MEENAVKKPLRTTLREMEIGEKISFPIEKIRTIKSYCTELKLCTKQQFTTSQSQKDHTVTVCRIS